jgi:transposase-like protein
MPDTSCPSCKRAGLVRKENVIKAGSATVSFYCGGCGYAWDEARDGEPDPPVSKRRSTNPPPDRSRS